VYCGSLNHYIVLLVALLRYGNVERAMSTTLPPPVVLPRLAIQLCGPAEPDFKTPDLLLPSRVYYWETVVVADFLDSTTPSFFSTYRLPILNHHDAITRSHLLLPTQEPVYQIFSFAFRPEQASTIATSLLNLTNSSSAKAVILLINRS
jgi:hypothetical protein